jgi:hypothetical protein
MDTPFALRVLGCADGRRELVSHRKAMILYAHADPRAHPEITSYLSVFTFPIAMRAHLKATGSVRDYGGPVGVPMLRWDLDDERDPDAALKRTKRLAGHLAERYGDEGLTVSFSGHKGFHTELDAAGAITPSDTANLVLRRLAETVAGAAGVTIDSSVYDKVRLWRAPNSRHGKSGLYKVPIDLDDLLHASVDWIRRRAVEPLPFDPRASPSVCPQLKEDWAQAERAVQDRAALERERSRERNGKVGHDAAQINALTRLLLTRPEEIQVGDRHRLIFSAAANLAEFTSIDDLIIALLTEPALDTGLPPREVARQIRCGIEHARHHPSEGGAA